MNHSNNISRDSSNQTIYSTNNHEESSFMDNASTQSFPMTNSSRVSKDLVSSEVLPLYRY
uniref:Uncharacterized protein n=1 Tax=Rhizophagus irregularis (strain DAOM 181602 / DAOM 197198 / MUCL 43194) TaxID=747089 RepID=U9T5U7_RHIID